MDAALQSLVEGVEAGKPGPPLRLLLPGGALRGTVIPITVFLDKMELELTLSAPRPTKGRGLRRRGDNSGGESVDYEAQAVSLLQPIRSSPPAQADAVSLSDVKWWSFDNKTTLQMPAVRVPFSAISAWWFAGETGEEEGTWYLGAGVLLPVDDDS
jgi:hypothetical protein